MKRIFIFSVLMIAFVMNAVAYEKGKLIERHIFRLMTPDERGASDYTYDWDDTDCVGNVRILKSITLSGRQKQTYLSWLDGTKRFIVLDYTKWVIGQNARPNLGVGLMNTDSNNQDFFIDNLKEGDKIVIEYYKNNANDTNQPKFVNDNIVGSSAGSTFYGTSEYEVASDGMVQISCPPRMLLCSVTITHANYKKADYSIDPVTEGGNTGYEFTITSSGVLEEKHPAIPYLTMAFGNDEDMTVVRNMNGNFAASSIIDPSHDLDITHDNVMLLHNYKKRYQNQSGQYVRQDWSWDWQNNTWYMNDNYANEHYNASDEAAVRQLAIDEVNRIKGQEWTMFRTDGYKWDTNPDFNWRREGCRAYRWADDFHSIWPLYGTYFYFFPEVRGKLSIKYYCEGNGQQMTFWWKAQDGKVVDQPVNISLNSSSQNIYELNDIEVVAGGAYYLCANPTLIEKEHPVMRLISFKFIPDFSVQPLYKVVENGTKSVNHACTIKGGPFNDLTVDKTNGKLMINGEEAAQVKFEGNIYDADFEIENGSGDEQYLNITNIKFKDKDAPSNTNVNKGGAIIVNLFCKASGDPNATDINKATFVLTVAYSAEPAVWNEDGTKRVRDPQGTGMAVKKWDFYTNELAVGQYKNGSGEYPSSDWTSSSTLYKEVNKFDHMTTDWVNTYADAENDGKEPIFKSVYDMEGDNADMLKETEGLVFMTETNLLGIYNENEASGEMTARDRYIGLMGTADWDMNDHHRKLIIPFLKAGDRVVMKLGTYGNADSEVPTETATLKMTNALDAVGNEITGDYIIGGSGVANGNDTNGGDDIKDKSKPWGEYHFQVKENGTNINNDFALEVKDAKLLKIYSIVIYRNANDNNASILTENEMLGDDNNRQILNTDQLQDPDNTQLHLHYRGLNEITNYREKEAMTGNLSTDNIISTVHESKPNWYIFLVNLPTKPADAKFGVFKARLGVKDLSGNNYVTDYADCMIPVGYRETKTYPYTWDFTDLKKYTGAGISTASGSVGNEVAVTTYMTNDDDLKIWDAYGLRVAPEKWDGNIFVSGGQLYGGTTMFDETRGIGIVHNGTNGVLSMTSEIVNNEYTLNGGLNVSIDDEIGYTIPSVAADQAIYVHATKKFQNGATAQYAIGTGGKQTLKSIGTDAFAMKMANNAATADVTLYFKGYEVNKIAVATDEKTVNALGWNTESRAHAIDPSLLPYMTGMDFRTYIATDVVDDENDKDKKLVTLKRIDGVTEKEGGDNSDANYIIPASIDEENDYAPLNGTPYACIIRNAGGAAVDLFGADSGFHLFAPDMHDAANKSASIWSKNLLKARVTKTTEKNGDTPADKVNPQDGDYTNYAFTNKHKNVVMGGEWKYDVQAFYRIMDGGAGSYGNQAYLSIKDESNPARISIFIEGEGEIGEATGIATVESTVGSVENDRYYNLNGQQLSGKPNRSGLYIVNGKKVYIKNK